MQHDKPVSDTASLAVIIVNYGTAALTIEGIDSVLAHSHGGRAVEIHVVDNGSPGADADLLAQAHQDKSWGAAVTLYPEQDNHGFGRGNNLVLEQLAARPTPPDYVFLLNPDARLKNDALGILADFLDQNPKAAFAGAAIEKPQTGPVTAAFRFPRPMGEFTRQLAFGPITRLRPNWVVPLPADHPEGPVDWVAGAAVMIRFRALKDLAFFDPGYFLYYEEVDLMHRAQRAGWQTCYVPRAQVIHAEGAATNVRSGTSVAPPRPSYWYQSWRKYFRDNYGRAGLGLAAFSWTMGAVGNHLLALVPGRTVSVPDRFFADFWALVWRPVLGLSEGRYD